MPFVLDASATLPWAFRDEASEASERLLERAAAVERIYVPPHWPAEVLNGLSRAVKRGRLANDALNTFLKDLVSFEIVVDSRPFSWQWADSHDLITTYGLSAYDAAYLALAKSIRVGLATFDEQLKLAASVEQVSVLF